MIVTHVGMYYMLSVLAKQVAYMEQFILQNLCLVSMRFAYMYMLELNMHQCIPELSTSRIDLSESANENV